MTPSKFSKISSVVLCGGIVAIGVAVPYPAGIVMLIPFTFSLVYAYLAWTNQITHW